MPANVRDPLSCPSRELAYKVVDADNVAGRPAPFYHWRDGTRGL